MLGRLYYIDNLRGFAILLVVLGHCIQYGMIDYSNNTIFKIIYSFHMPLFFIISGFVSYKQHPNISDIIKRRTIQLLIPYFSFGILTLIYNGGGNFCSLFICPDKHLWFLWILFLVSIISAFIESNVQSDWKNTLLQTIVVGALLFISMNVRNNAWGIKLLALYYPYYALGLILRKFHIDELTSKKPYYFVALASMFLYVIFMLGQNYFLSQHQPFPLIVDYIFRVLTSLTACSSIFCLFKIYLNKSSVLCYLSKSSLGIYAIHFYWIRLFLNYGFNVVWTFVSALALTILSVELLRTTKFLKPIIGEKIVN